MRTTTRATTRTTTSEHDDEHGCEHDSGHDDDGDYGKTLEGPIIVFDGGSDYCEGSGGQFNGYEPVIGFAWAVIYDVRTEGSASEKNIRVKIDTEAEEAFGLVGGGTLYAGVTHATPGVIVR
ncbi:MAG: hypothetical protein GXP62_06985 [Oligoflexia bacterium]|nr:hypothetical protein [Oligoflexia bacterium]